MNPDATIYSRRRHRPDYVFIICIGGLLLLGLIILYSISPILSHKILGDVSRNYFLYNQLLHIAVGLAGFTFASRVHHQRWQGWLPLLLIAAGLGVLLTLIPALSVTKNGATRWVELGPLSFQPAEIVKFCLVIGMASWFANLRGEQLNDRFKTLWPVVGLLGILGLLILFIQKDMGTMLVLGAIIVGTFYASGVSLRQVGSLLAIAGGMGVASILLFPHRLSRVLTFFNPSQSVHDQGYHLNQALIAVGSGGLLGLGIGKSVQVYGYLPEAASDSIFAIIGETFGLIGALIILGIFGLLVYRGLKIALAAPTRYAQLLGLGIMVWLASQTLINVAAMIGLVPLTGIPLPFLSYGGTSLVMIMTAMGIMVNISKYTQRGLYADSAVRRGDGRSHYAYSSPGPRA